MYVPDFCLFAGLAWCAREFETADFSVTTALSDLGVNVSLISDPLVDQSPTSACSLACNSLELTYGASSIDKKNETSYSNFTGTYWSTIQGDVHPYCIFKPSITSAVSVLVLLSRLTHCPLAVTSGGHAAFAGASSIEGGITLSFENLNAIELAADQKTVSIQPGNTWHTIYTKLAESDLVVMGGRVASVGIGGLTTGGGISFFSNIHGFACDNVASYDVVTASGVIVTASPTQYPDLYWALRGGGNNFGIVVAFRLKTFSLPRGDIWGGSKLYREDSFAEVVDAFASLIANSPDDPNAGTWCAWASIDGVKYANVELWYAKPNGQNAAIFDEFNNITSISDTTQNRTLTEYTEVVEDQNPHGLREVFYHLTMKASAEVASAAKDIFFEESETIMNVAGVSPVLVFQGITAGELVAMTKNGGNPLGLVAADGPFYIILISVWWNNEEDDDAVYQMLSTTLTRIKAEAVSHGVQNDYLYMNYASQFQDVISSYGAENKARLKSIAANYDPSQVFQVLQPGYFKLDRAPVPKSGYFSY